MWSLKLLVVIVTIIWVSKVTAAPPSSSYDKIELTNPMRLNQVPGIIPYESIAKYVIQLDLPDLKELMEVENDEEDVMSSVLESIRSEFGSSLIPNYDLRYPVDSIMSRTSNFVFGTEDQMKSYVNILSNHDLKGFSLHRLNFSSLLKRTLITKFQQLFQQFLNSTVSNVEGLPSHQDPIIVLQKYRTYLVHLIRSTLDSCFNRTLPTVILGDLIPAILNETLSAEEENLPKGYKFVISSQNWDLLRNQSLTDCLFTPKRLYITLNVPVVQKEARWQIYQARHSKFVFEDKICSVGPEHDRFYAYDRGHEHTVDLDGTRGTTCKLDGFNQLCYIPTEKPQKGNQGKKGKAKADDTEDLNNLEKLQEDSFSCSTGILNALPLKDLRDECTFSCTSSPVDEPFLEETEDSRTVFLTNVRSLKVFCPRSNLTKSLEKIGAVKIQLRACDCYLWADDMFYSFQSCLQDKCEQNGMEANEGGAKIQNENDGLNPRDSDVDVSYLIPFTWTKNNAKSMIMEESISFRIINYKEILDIDWLETMSGVKSERPYSSFSGKYWNFFDADYPD